MIVGHSAKERLFLCVYVEFAEDELRIVSARRTTNRERRDHEEASKRTGPSRKSLREIPEVDLKDGRWRPNPYAARIAAEGITLAKRGRPKTRGDRGVGNIAGDGSGAADGSQGGSSPHPQGHQHRN